MLSILIPAYNYNVLPLAEELHRQAAKEGIDFEIIIADDCSTNLREIDTAALPGNILYIRNEKNLGRTLTRKKLAEAAKYSQLLFLDADVMPASTLFIQNYLPYCNDTDVILGGIAYKEADPGHNKVLRYKYGHLREQRSAVQRSKNPYDSILSANMLLPKPIFLQHNYPFEDNFYGMDTYFSHSLYTENIPVVHIDNPVYHMGLENDDVFFKKSLEAIKNRKALLTATKGAEDFNALSKYYKTLQRYHLAGLAGFSFKITEPLLRKMILKKNPSLFYFDIYRLGYICSLKD